MTTTGAYTVYEVVNKTNDKKYIGYTSRNLNIRWKEHVRHANKTANNGSFYKSIRKYGENNFIINIICIENTLRGAKESEILLILDKSPEYNSTFGGDGSPGHSLSIEARMKMGGVHKGNKYNLGRKWTEEQKLKMSLNKKGCKAPPLSQKMIETRLDNVKRSVIKRSKPVICLNDGFVYKSVTSAAKKYNLDKTTVSYICSGKRNSAYGLKFSFHKPE